MKFGMMMQFGPPQADRPFRIRILNIQDGSSYHIKKFLYLSNGLTDFHEI